METETLLKKDWTVTPEAFDKLLAWLDADREAAGEKYEKIRQKLIKLFKWRNCTPEEEYADLTINRVTRRVFEGANVSDQKPYLYFHGIALNVIREYWRGRLKHKREDFEELNPLELAADSPHQKMEQEVEQDREAGRFACMQECLRALPADTRDFIVEYHHGESKKDVRKEMAEKLKVPMNVLRIRACRVREGLQRCVDGCLKRA
jgi:DNA-directed RNA polymerase specialized sigma24 family protein